MRLTYFSDHRFQCWKCHFPLLVLKLLFKKCWFYTKNLLVHMFYHHWYFVIFLLCVCVFISACIHMCRFMWKLGDNFGSCFSEYVIHVFVKQRLTGLELELAKELQIILSLQHRITITYNHLIFPYRFRGLNSNAQVCQQFSHLPTVQDVFLWLWQAPWKSIWGSSFGYKSRSHSNIERDCDTEEGSWGYHFHFLYST